MESPIELKDTYFMLRSCFIVGCVKLLIATVCRDYLTCTDDVFSPEAKKVTAVYTRRPKKAAPQVSEPSEPSREAAANPPPEKRNSIFVFRDEG